MKKYHIVENYYFNKENNKIVPTTASYRSRVSPTLTYDQAMAELQQLQFQGPTIVQLQEILTNEKGQCVGFNTIDQKSNLV